MLTRNIFIGLVGCVVFFGTSSIAVAGDREIWKFEGGTFVKLKGNHWVERSDTSKDKFRFVETQRTEEFVELYDKSREFTIRLRKNQCMLRQGADGKFEKLYEGNWADK